MFLQTYRLDLDPAKNNYTFVGWDGGVDSQNPFSVIEGVRVSRRHCGEKQTLADVGVYRTLIYNTLWALLPVPM